MGMKAAMSLWVEGKLSLEYRNCQSDEKALGTH